MISGALFVGGDPPQPSSLPSGFDDLTIAADSGYSLAIALRRRVNMLVGDLDSIDPDSLVHAEASNVDIRRHPAHKDHTDFELAVGAAIDCGVERLLVVGGLGGRLDHLLAILERMRALRNDLSALAFAIGGFQGWVLKSEDRADIPQLRQFSVLAGPSGAIVSITGAAWTADRAHFAYGSGNGLSNMAHLGGATVVCHGGSAITMTAEDE